MDSQMKEMLGQGKGKGHGEKAWDFQALSRQLHSPVSTCSPTPKLLEPWSLGFYEGFIT